MPLVHVLFRNKVRERSARKQYLPNSSRLDTRWITRRWRGDGRLVFPIRGSLKNHLLTDLFSHVCTHTHKRTCTYVLFLLCFSSSVLAPLLTLLPEQQNPTVPTGVCRCVARHGVPVARRGGIRQCCGCRHVSPFLSLGQRQQVRQW